MTLGEEYRQHRDGDWCDIQGHMGTLHTAVLSRPGAVVTELGVRTGMSTISFLAAAQQVGGEVWSADIAPPEVPAHWHDLDFWYLTLGDDLHPAILRAMPAQCDVLLIDTSHEYDHTLEELRAYVPRVRPGGIVFCHDTQFAPPGTDLGEPVGEVAKALDAYCAETGLSWENTPGFYGLGTIRL